MGGISVEMVHILVSNLVSVGILYEDLEILQSGQIHKSLKSKIFAINLRDELNIHLFLFFSLP